MAGGGGSVVEEVVGAGRWVGGRRVVAVVQLVGMRVLVVQLPWVMDLRSEGVNSWAVWWWKRESVGVYLEQEGERALEVYVEVFLTRAGVRVVKVHL